jgi:hypothetical protein
MKRLLRAVHRLHSLSRDPKEPFRPPTPLRGRIAAARLHLPFTFQAIERGINCANRYLALCAEFELLPHRDSIGAVFQPQKGENNDVLEFAKIIAPSHYLYNIDQIEASQITLPLRTLRV